MVPPRLGVWAAAGPGRSEVEGAARRARRGGGAGELQEVTAAEGARILIHGHFLPRVGRSRTTGWTTAERSVKWRDSTGDGSAASSPSLPLAIEYYLTVFARGLGIEFEDTFKKYRLWAGREDLSARSLKDGQTSG